MYCEYYCHPVLGPWAMSRYIILTNIHLQSEVTILWSSWNDSLSGIGTFTYAIYGMAPNQDNELAELKDPLVEGVWNTEDPPTYTPRTAGTYRYACPR